MPAKFLFGESDMSPSGVLAGVHKRDLPGSLATVSSIAMLAVLCCYPVLTYQFGRTVTVDNKLFVALIELAFVFSAAIAAEAKWAWPSIISRRTGILLLGFLASVALSTALSSRPAVSIVRTAEWLTHLVFAFAVFNFFRRKPAVSRLVPVVVGLAFLLYFVTFLSEYLLSHNDPFVNWVKYMPGFTHIRHLGYLLAFVIPVAACYWLGEERASRVARSFSLVVACLAWMLVFEIGGRGPIFAIAGSLVVLPLFAGSKKQLLTILAFTLCAALAGVVLSIVLLDIGFGLEQMRGGFERDTLNAFSSNRLGIWTVTLELIAPALLLGTGPDTYMFLPKGMEMGTVQPHGFHIQALADWGVVGCSLLLAVGASFLMDMRDPSMDRARKFNGLSLVFLWTILVLLAFSLVDGVLYHSFSSALFFLAAGVFFAAREPHVQGAQNDVGAGSRILLAGLVVFSLATMTGHALSLSILRGEHPGSPEEFNAKFMRLFPSALTDLGGGYVLYSWIQSWQGIEPKRKAEWYDWADLNARQTPVDPEKPESGSPGSTTRLHPG